MNIIFSNKLETRSIEDLEIDKFEKDFQVKLPERYKEILRNNNGSRPSPSEFYVSFSGNQEECSISEFIELYTPDGRFGSIYDFSEILHSDNGISQKIIPFGIDGGGNLTCFDYRESDLNPKIVFWKHDEDRGLDFVADSFDEFLSNLY